MIRLKSCDILKLHYKHSEILLRETGWMVPIIWDRYLQLVDRQACVPVWHLERIVPIIWDQYIACWKARLVSLCGIQSTELIVCWIATLVSLCCIKSQMGCFLVDFDSGRIGPGQIRVSRCLLQVQNQGFQINRARLVKRKKLFCYSWLKSVNYISIIFNTFRGTTFQSLYCMY